VEFIAVALGEIQKAVKCVEKFRDPKLFSCRHSCLLKLQGRKKTKGGSYQHFIARRGRRATAVKRLEIREILGTKTMREITLK
jgi:hypothetical protein